MRQPADQKPSFSVATLRKAIPKHCWERSLLRSSTYLAADLAMLAALVYASFFIDSAPVPPAVRWLVLWPAYWFFAGAVATGVWVSCVCAWLPGVGAAPEGHVWRCDRAAAFGSLRDRRRDVAAEARRNQAL